MDHQELLEQFVSITSAAPQIALHILEAHGYDLDASVDFYLDSGGVGHGHATVEDLTRDPQNPFVYGDHQPPLPASAAPRSAPIEVFDEDNDIEVVASNLAHRSRRHVEDIIDDGIEEEWQHDDMELDDDDIDDDADVHRERRIRRNRPRGARQRDRHLEPLQPNNIASSSRTAQFASHRLPTTMHGTTTTIDLPDDVNLEEQKMLLAAMMGETYEGPVPDFINDHRFAPRSLSPGALAREQLRQEQDAAYQESLLMDAMKEEAEERKRKEAESAAAAALEKEKELRREEEEQKIAFERSMSMKESMLPSEPELGDEDCVMIVVRLPAGGRCSRRFRKGDGLRSLFDFVDVSTRGSEVLPGTYNLVSQFPRRVFESEEGGDLTLAEVGLFQKQEAVFIEMK